MMGNRPELFKQETLKPKNLSHTLARLGSYFGRFWYVLIIVLALITISTWTQVITPELTGQATDCFLVPLGNQFDSFGPQARRLQSREFCCCLLAWYDRPRLVDLYPSTDLQSLHMERISRACQHGIHDE